MLKLPMDAIKNYHGCSQQWSHKIAEKAHSFRSWLLLLVFVWYQRDHVGWELHVKTILMQVLWKKCIVLTSTCLVKVAKAKHLVAVWKILVWYRGYRGYRGFQHTLMKIIVLQVKEIFYWLLVHGIPHHKLLNVWQRSLALQPYSRFFW